MSNQIPAATTWQLFWLSESVLSIRFAHVIDQAINQTLHKVRKQLLAAQWPNLIEIVPAYCELALQFSVPVYVREQIEMEVRTLLLQVSESAEQSTIRIIEIPVCYGDEFGPDLLSLSAHTGLTVQEIIVRHCATDYQVAMLGFMPGFPYLLGLDPCLAMPRKSTPRLSVPAGSVAIGGAQTGIYPTSSPGGWQLIGRSSVSLFDWHRAQPCLLQAGDRVRFSAISRAQIEHSTVRIIHA